MQASKSLTDVAFPQVLLRNTLERIFLVECITSTFLARHLQDVVFLSSGNPIILLERIELVTDHVSTVDMGRIPSVILTFFFHAHLSAFAFPESGSTAS